MEIKDSLNFLSSSLDSLVKNLRDKGKEDLKKTFPHIYAYFKKKWPEIDEEAFDMLTGN